MLVWYFVAYFLGTIPFGFGVGKLVKKMDIREHGSKNIGATNVFRVVGKKWGITVLLLDAFKGWLACSLPELFFHQAVSLEQKLGLAVIAILGHTFPIWLKFKGGKGVATSLGVFLAVAWVPTLCAFLFWAIIFTLFRIISVASLATAFVYPLFVFFFEHSEPGFLWLQALSILLTFFIFYTHRANIQRILKKEEKRLF